MNAAQNQNAFHAWSDEAKAMAIQARVLSGEKLGQLVCRLQRHSGRSRESCWRFVLQTGLKIRDEHRRWTDDELDTLREHIATHSVEETAKVLGRSVKSVRCVLQRNELKVREIRCDWMSIESLARILHVRKTEILSWIEKGWLEATIRVHGRRSSYAITPEAFRALYSHHLNDLLTQKRIPNVALFEAFYNYCFVPKHTIGSQLLTVRRDKRERETCWLETWSKQAQTDGRRALDQLRVGVQKALENLGTGFIAHKANQTLRDRLQVGELQKQDFYRQLLRLVYRLIFLFVAEDRDLLHFPGASDDARSRYARFYSGQRLRRMAERTRGSRHADLWVGLRLVFTKLGNDYGCPELGLPALGGFLFGSQAMPDLEFAELANEHLLLAIRNLGLVKDRSGWRLVDYRNLGSEELGSVYESLLELNPTMELPAGIFTLDTVAGNQRKTSGSYYTPDSLVQCLLDSALDPVVELAIKGKTAAEAEKAILALKVCDPAVGSGHFLVGAAHRLAKHLANVRAQAQGESEPSPLYYQHALRDVIGHCLYGVDVNPMAAELCRVSLWLEAIEPGKPLSFLDHHIRVGNSLLGATPALLAKGIPDEAFTPIEGDDKEICSRFKKVNKTEKVGYRRLFAATTEPWERLGDLAASMVHLDNAPDDSIEAVRNKERMYEAMVRSGNYVNGQFWADTWCAAFVWKKTQEFNHPITEEDFRRIEHNPHACDAWMRDEIMRLSQQYQFFHWHLAFPDVFHIPSSEQTAENEQAGWNGGFDAVLGNPPWERVKLQEKEWFAHRNAEIATNPNKSARERLIRALQDEDSGLFSSFRDALRVP